MRDAWIPAFAGMTLNWTVSPPKLRMQGEKFVFP